MKKIYLLAAMFCSLACSAQSVTTDSILNYFIKKPIDPFFTDKYFNAKTVRRFVIAVYAGNAVDEVSMDGNGKFEINCKDSLSAIKLLMAQLLVTLNPDDQRKIYGSPLKFVQPKDSIKVHAF